MARRGGANFSPPPPLSRNPPPTGGQGGGGSRFPGLALRPGAPALRGGQKGGASAPGRAADSRLYRVVAGLEKPAMPLDGKLTPAQIDLIKDWIDQGAAWDDLAPSTAS